MKAVILTMASIRRYDDHADALYVLEEEEKTQVLEAIQRQQLSDAGMLIVIEGYANIQSVGSDQTVLMTGEAQTEAAGNSPNAETLYRQAIYFGGRGVLGVRVVYTTDPLKRIVYDITAEGDVQVAHV